MKIQIKHGLLAVLIIITAVVYFLYLKPVRETIIFFPLDPSLQFDIASTALETKQGNGSYSISWSELSVLNTQAYLRQDISLLYKNGKLVSVLKDWKQNSQSITQAERLPIEESSMFQAVTFHYAEVHPSESEIYSAQSLTGDQLYVIRSPYSTFQSFKHPTSAEQKEWKLVLDQTANSVITESLNQAVSAFAIDRNRYSVAALTDLKSKQGNLLTGYTESKQNEIIGKLWEGLYRNYVLGIKHDNGNELSPLGSSVPLLLVAQDKKELLVVFSASDGSPVMLRQKLPTPR
ncbi:hypothetical protein [Peribacillus glennii]|uniref:Uncharacterized protein n=1 Tax=Peribacillus glennii TaxID=2303991 RepID=A0A372LI95_9BACI|nr:hypothetical protein [Peribacillus glennii]RFU65702.1 hypothetical protein D0466_07470 [Peribacillus glennii]